MSLGLPVLLYSVGPRHRWGRLSVFRVCRDRPAAVRRVRQLKTGPERLNDEGVGFHRNGPGGFL